MRPLYVIVGVKAQLENIHNPVGRPMVPSYLILPFYNGYIFLQS